ncbi:MAG: hypothetical protein GX589_03235 [Deltaproteobacteria bacterium]|nr:hypothetical protein [Deltaproteobacteria bacterium]
MLGGFLNLSGFSSDTVTANNYAIGRAVFYNKLASLGSSLFGGGIYGGASLELATIHTDTPILGSYALITAGSVFLGVDTPIAPLYLAFGLNDESQQAIYLVLGRLPGSLGY